MSAAFTPHSRTRWTLHDPEPGLRLLPEETPVALVHNASTTAVMMATPEDLLDFGVGFSLTEGVADRLQDIVELETAQTDLGVEVRIWLREPLAARLSARRRTLAGPTGCGLCGVEGLAAALRPTPQVGSGDRVTPGDIRAALEALPGAQPLGSATRATHAAAWWTRPEGVVAVREDVGRHNALDKLVGALARQGIGPRGGLLLLTSRVSVEMVQKAAALSAQVVVAVSAPTALAVRTAEAAGVTLVAVARNDGFEVFCHEERIVR